VLSRLSRQDADEAARRCLEAVRLQKEAVGMSGNNRNFRQELALGLSDLAGAQSECGQTELAEQMAREALKLRLDLHAEDKKERWFELYVARSHRQLGSILQSTKPDEAEAEYNDAIKLLDGLVNDFPSRPTNRVKLVETQIDLADFLKGPDRLEDVEKLIDKAVGHLEKLATDHPDEPNHLRRQAGAYFVLGQRLRTHKKHDKAQQAFRKLLDANDRVVRKFNDRTDRYNHAWDHSLLSETFEESGNLDEAVKCMQQSQQELRTLVKEFPMDDLFGRKMSSRGDELSRVLRKANKPKEALAASRTAAADWQDAIERFPKDVTFPNGLGFSLGQQGDILRDVHLYAEAAKVYRAAVRAAPNDVDVLRVASWYFLYSPDAKLHSPAEARELAERAVKAAPNDAIIWNSLGVARFRLGDHKNAIKALEESARLDITAVDLPTLGMAYWKIGNFEAAGRWLKKKSMPKK
jgi:tetratricopeptide (TPR) repeat protein